MGEPIDILLNGKKTTLTNDVFSLAKLIETLNLNRKNIVAELNGELINQSQFDNSILVHNDKLELIRFVGGGTV
ncbi:sulfur carrier protein ThiS [bacterium]|jgi:sulfur carrier protein|nr:sulfur carrier protein ThiS [bacterium]